MAARNRSNSIAADFVVELEALRKEDSSWRPCHVSLSSSGIELIVDCGNNDSKRIIVSEEEAVSHLRIRSIPLDGDDCASILEGDHVLATQNSQSESLFFDAEVVKALRVRHSKKVHCRCTFVIKWLHQGPKGGTLTVPSSSVMKLALKSIDEHPTVSAFFSMMEKSMACSSPPPLPIITADLDFDFDLHELLEKQIEAISSLADMSNKRVWDSTVFCMEDCKEQTQCRADAASNLNKSHVQAPPDHNHLKRTKPRRKNMQVEIEVKDTSPRAPSIQEELSESRSPLNPLAARAAFASLLSKMPHTSTSVPFDPETNKDVNLFISTTSASGNTQRMDTSFVMLTKEREVETKTSEIHDSRASFACSLDQRKLNQSPKVTKLTRSAIKKGTGITGGSNVKQKLQTSSNPGRFTRSAVCKAKEPQTVEDKQRMEENKSGKHFVRNHSEQNIEVLEKNALEDRKLVISQNVSAVELLPNQDMNSLRQKEPGKKMQAGSPHIEQKHNGGKMSSVVKATEKNQGEGKSSRSLKRKSAPSNELQHSPCLQSLPRTQSKIKSYPGKEV